MKREEEKEKETLVVVVVVMMRSDLKSGREHVFWFLKEIAS